MKWVVTYHTTMVLQSKDYSIIYDTCSVSYTPSVCFLWRYDMITQYDRNGFSINFVNGYSISVIWNTGSYSDNRSNSLPTSSTVEVGIFPTADGTSKFIRPDYRFEPEESNDVIPFVQTELLAKLIMWTQGLRSVTP